MAQLKNTQEIELMRHSALLVSECLTEVAKILKPGITTLSIDNLIAQFIKDHWRYSFISKFSWLPFQFLHIG
jgi:methionyl aminopeptidase